MSVARRLRCALACAVIAPACGVEQLAFRLPNASVPAEGGAAGLGVTIDGAAGVANTSSDSGAGGAESAGGESGSGESGAAGAGARGGAPAEVTGTLVRVSRSTQPNVVSGHASISADGRRVVFDSTASDLVDDDQNSNVDVFLHDLTTRETRRISVTAAGAEVPEGAAMPQLTDDGANVVFSSLAADLVPDQTASGSLSIFRHTIGVAEAALLATLVGPPSSLTEPPRVSSDGRVVAFASELPLVPDDTNEVTDVFVLEGGSIERISVTSGGEQASGPSLHPRLSADGNVLAFSSYAPDLVPDDTNDWSDVFVHDRRTGETRRVNLGANGAESNGSSTACDLSGDGKRVAFRSIASNLTANDASGTVDIFVRELAIGETRLASVPPAGEETRDDSSQAALDHTGRLVVFIATAANLGIAGEEIADVLVRDLLTQTTTRISVPRDGGASAISFEPAVSPDGRVVVFTSVEDDLTSDDGNGSPDVFAFTFTSAPWLNAP